MLDTLECVNAADSALQTLDLDSVEPGDRVDDFLGILKDLIIIPRPPS